MGAREENPEDAKQPSLFGPVSHTVLMVVGVIALAGGAALTTRDSLRGMLLMLVGIVTGLWGVAVWRDSAALKIVARLLLYATAVWSGISGFAAGQYIFRNFMFVGFGSIVAIIETIDLIRLLAGKGPPPDSPRAKGE